MVEQKATLQSSAKTEPEFIRVPNCHGFMQKRLDGENTFVGKFNPDKPMKQEEVFMPPT